METLWFLFNGSKQPFDPDSYIKADGVPEYINSLKLYAIEANLLPNGRPDFNTPGLKDNMLRALVSGKEQANPGVKLKKITYKNPSRIIRWLKRIFQISW